MRMFACVVAVSVVGAVWAAEDAGYLIRLRSGGKPAFMRFVEADGKKIAAPLRPEEESVGQFGLPEARIGFWHRMGKFADGRLPCLYVRPSLKGFLRSGRLCPEGVALTNAWKTLPGVCDRAIRLDVMTDDYGETALWGDGSWLTRLGTREKCPRSIWFDSTESNVVTKVRSLYAGVDTRLFLPLDIKLVPRPGSFTNAVTERIALPKDVPWFLADANQSSDAAVCKMVVGAYDLECDGYTGRAPAEAYPYSIHYHVPTRVYTKAHVVFALENDTNRFVRVANFRIGRYLPYGSGSDMYSDSKFDLTAGIPSDCREIGTVRRDRETLKVYYAAVPLANDKVLDVTVRAPCVDFEILGPVDEGWVRHYPDKKRKSAFHFLGVTLEKGVVSLDEISDKGHPLNAWTFDEKEKSCGFKVRAQCGATKANLRWKCRDVDGRTVLSGDESLSFSALGEEKVAPVNLNALKEPGLFKVEAELKGDDGSVLRHEMRVALLVASGRVVSREKSPYAVWPWPGGTHGTPTQADDWLAPLGPAGIRKVTAPQFPLACYGKYKDVTFAGWVMPLRQEEFDATAGCFRAKDGKDGETRFVEDLKAKIAKLPYVDHVMIWHEGAPGTDGNIPEELLGRPVPPATAAQIRAAKYMNECGRILRKHFPHLPTRVGNTGSNIQQMAALGRGGANFDYVDAIGNEATCQTICPERLMCGNVNGAHVARRVAEHYAKRPIRVDGCYEFTSRRAHHLGERLEAAWIVRDGILGLVNGYTLLDLAGVYDVRTGYADTIWGSGGSLFGRLPYCAPRELYVAYAALTKALDGVTFVRQLDTGSSTVYAALFRRCDGRFATAVWCSRGEAELDFEVPGNGTVMDMFGREKPLRAGWAFSPKRVTAGACPSYVLTGKPVEGAKIVRRTFPAEEARAALGRPGDHSMAAAEPYLKPEPRLMQKNLKSLPMLVTNDHFAVSIVKDAERGASVELRHLDERHDPKQSNLFTEVTTIRLKKPIRLEGRPRAVGVWVKGNSNRGAIRFEVRDAKGYVYANYLVDAPGLAYNPFDWPGVQGVDFDGWCFVSSAFEKGDLHLDEKLGLIGRAVLDPWIDITPFGHAGQKGLHYPIEVTAISVEFNPEKFGLRDFEKSAPTILLHDVVGIE